MTGLIDGMGFATLIAALFTLPYVLAAVTFVVLFPIYYIAAWSGK